MDLIRGWERRYTPDVTGGLRLSKARLYREIEDEQGVGDIREGEIRTGVWGRVAREPHEGAGAHVPDFPLNISVFPEADESELEVEDLQPGESRDVLQNLRINDSALDSPFLLCLSRKPLTTDEWKLMQTALPDRYDTWTITKDVNSLNFEIEWGIKRWLELNGITEHRIFRRQGWVDYPYDTNPPPLEPSDALVEASQIGRWYRKSRKFSHQREYRFAWHITSPQLDKFPDAIDIELTRSGLTLFAPWSPPTQTNRHPPQANETEETSQMRATEPQETHAIYLDHDQVGNPRVSITLARRGRRGGGKRIRSLTGRDRDVAYPHLSTILWNHHGKQLETAAQDLPPGEYHPISEVAATQMLLLMDAVKGEPKTERAQRLGAAIADMHNCEASWWWACHQNRSRPRKVIRALALMYG